MVVSLKVLRWHRRDEQWTPELPLLRVNFDPALVRLLREVSTPSRVSGIWFTEEKMRFLAASRSLSHTPHLLPVSCPGSAKSHVRAQFMSGYPWLWPPCVGAPYETGIVPVPTQTALLTTP